MRILYCSICSTNFDVDAEGIEGDIGIIPVAFCPTCKAGIRDFAEQTWDLIPRDMCSVCAADPCECAPLKDNWDCGCSDQAEAACISVTCPRK